MYYNNPANLCDKVYQWLS